MPQGYRVTAHIHKYKSQKSKQKKILCNMYMCAEVAEFDV